MTQDEGLDFAAEVELRGLTKMVLTAAKKYRVTVEEIGGRGRSRRMVAARCAIVQQLRHPDEPGAAWSWPEIGRLFRRDHTTMAKYYADGAGVGDE